MDARIRRAMALGYKHAATLLSDDASELLRYVDGNLKIADNDIKSGRLSSARMNISLANIAKDRAKELHKAVRIALRKGNALLE